MLFTIISLFNWSMHHTGQRPVIVIITTIVIITKTGAKSFPKKKKKNRVTRYTSYFCTKSSPIKLLHVNMYANFLIIPLSTRYYCPDSSHIKLNHMNTVQMTNTANFSTAMRHLLTVSPCSLRQKYIHVIHYARFCTTLHGLIAVAPRPVMSTTSDTPHTPTNVTIELSYFLNYVCKS